jgi:thioredoxin
MKQIGEQDFDGAVSNGAVLVDFSAEWCGPCKTMMPLVEKLANEFDGKLSVYTVDIDSDPALAARNGVMSVPTFLVFQQGRQVERIVGAVSEKEFRKKLEPFLEV